MTTPTPTPTPAFTMAAQHPPELTTVEHSAVLRACREKRLNLRTALEHLRQLAKLGDKSADTASIVVDAELSILEAAIRVLWKQSGCDPPTGD